MQEGEDMVHCPYNISHVLLRTRLPSHLIKCRQQHVIEKYKTCPFNSTHDVPEIELEYHVQSCPDRKNLENFLYVVGEPKPIELPTPSAVPVSSENWDEEESQSISYLDVKDQRLDSEKVFRVPVGMTKGQRKAFFQNEVLKFEKANSARKDSMSSATGYDFGQSTSELEVMNGKKLKKKEHRK